jgi:exodeoxyribonuclease VII small subunit
MADESYSFSTARTRLEAIVTQVRKKDTSLEKSLDLLEEGVRLANACTELIDHADWVAAGATPEADGAPSSVDAEQSAEAAGPQAVAGAGSDVFAHTDVSDAYAVDDVDEQEPAAQFDADDPAEGSWAEEVPAGDLGADDDPSSDER